MLDSTWVPPFLIKCSKKKKETSSLKCLWSLEEKILLLFLFTFTVCFTSCLLIQVSLFIYERKFSLTCRVQIAPTHFAPLLFHLVSLCFNLWKHLFWDGLALGDSFGPGIAHITAILNLTKPDCSKRTFGLVEIGYSSSSTSLRLGLDRGKGNYSCSTVKLAKVWNAFK